MKNNQQRKNNYSQVLDSPYKNTSDNKSSSVFKGHEYTNVKPDANQDNINKENDNVITHDSHKITSYENHKATSYEIRLTLPVNKDQFRFLEELELQIKTKREKAYRKERITKNNIIRALIEYLQTNIQTIDLDNIRDDEDLKVRINKIG
jgi:hypothetical protein